MSDSDTALSPTAAVDAAEPARPRSPTIAAGAKALLARQLRAAVAHRVQGRSQLAAASHIGDGSSSALQIELVPEEDEMSTGVVSDKEMAGEAALAAEAAPSDEHPHRHYRSSSSGGGSGKISRASDESGFLEGGSGPKHFADKGRKKHRRKQQKESRKRRQKKRRNSAPGPTSTLPAHSPSPASSDQAKDRKRQPKERSKDRSKDRSKAKSKDQSHAQSKEQRRSKRRAQRREEKRQRGPARDALQTLKTAAMFKILFDNQLELASGQHRIVQVPRREVPQPCWNSVCSTMRNPSRPVGDYVFFDGWDLYPSRVEAMDTVFVDPLIRLPNPDYMEGPEDATFVHRLVAGDVSAGL